MFFFRVFRAFSRAKLILECDSLKSVTLAHTAFLRNANIILFLQIDDNVTKHAQSSNFSLWLISERSKAGNSEYLKEKRQTATLTLAVSKLKFEL